MDRNLRAIIEEDTQCAPYDNKDAAVRKRCEEKDSDAQMRHSGLRQERREQAHGAWRGSKCIGDGKLFRLLYPVYMPDLTFQMYHPLGITPHVAGVVPNEEPYLRGYDVCYTREILYKRSFGSLPVEWLGTTPWLRQHQGLQRISLTGRTAVCPHCR